MLIQVHFRGFKKGPYVYCGTVSVCFSSYSCEMCSLLPSSRCKAMDPATGHILVTSEPSRNVVLNWAVCKHMFPIHIWGLLFVRTYIGTHTTYTIDDNGESETLSVNFESSECQPSLMSMVRSYVPNIGRTLACVHLRPIGKSKQGPLNKVRLSVALEIRCYDGSLTMCNALYSRFICIFTCTCYHMLPHVTTCYPERPQALPQLGWWSSI